MRRAVLRPALTTLGADKLAHLGLHDLRRHRPHGLADHIDVQLTANLVHNAIVHNVPRDGGVWLATSARPETVGLTVEYRVRS